MTAAALTAAGPAPHPPPPPPAVITAASVLEAARLLQLSVAPPAARRRMLEVARDELHRQGFHVGLGLLSPVGDGYGKPGLAPCVCRVSHGP